MTLDPFDFWINGVLSCCIALIGLIMNFTSIYILSRRKEKSTTFNHMLIVLFTIDSIVLFTSILSDIVWNLRLEHIWVLIILYPYFTYPINNIALTASIFCTISISHDRFGAIKHPIEHRQKLKGLCERRKHLAKYLAPIILLAIFINIPTFFEFDIIYASLQIHEYLSNETMKDSLITQPYVDGLVKGLEFKYNSSAAQSQIKVSSTNADVPWIYVSKQAFTHMYEFDRIYHWICLIMTGILPFCFLSYFNFRLYKEVKKHGNIFSLNQQKSIDSIKSVGGQLIYEDDKTKEEFEMAKVLIGIVIIFLICHIMKNACDVVWGLSMFFPSIKVNDIAYETGKFEIIGGLGKLLVVVNSSLNMVIYGFINKRFLEEGIKHFKSCFCADRRIKSLSFEEKEKRSDQEIF